MTDTAVSGESLCGNRVRRFGAADLLRYGAIIAFAAILVVFSLAAPGFSSLPNIGNLLAQSAVLGPLAYGMSIVVIAGGSNVVRGGIDLSLAANVGLGGAVYAVLLRESYGDTAAIAATLAAGLAIGAVNAIAVIKLGIIPLLATLAVMNMAAGLELVLTENTIVPATSGVLTALSGTGPFELPMLAYALLAVTALLVILVQYTAFGLRLYGAGEFPEAARAAGLSLGRLYASAFLLSGLCGGLGAIFSVAYLSGSTTGSSDLLLPVVVTGFLGVVFSRRLVPSIGGAFISTLLISVLLNGFQLMNVSSYWVSGVEGILILAVVSATSLFHAKRGRP